MTTSIPATGPDAFLECVELLQQVDFLLGTPEPMTPDEIRRRTPFSSRCARVAESLATICTELEIAHGDDVHEMMTSLSEAERTRLILDRVDVVRARIDARRMQHESRAARATNKLYGLVTVLARHDVSIRARVEPIVALLRTRRTRGRPRLTSPISKAPTKL